MYSISFVGTALFSSSVANCKITSESEQEKTEMWIFILTVQQNETLKKKRKTVSDNNIMQ